jgi:dihydroorotase
MPLIVKNVRLIDPAQNMDTEGALLVEDGRVAAIGKRIGECIGECAGHPMPPETEVIDGLGNVLAPGFIDLHVHFREPGQTAKETIETGCRAAVAGGFTSVCAMANTKPANDCAAITDLMLARAAKAGLCRYFPLGALTKGLGGEELADYSALKAAGCIAFSDDGNPVMNAAVFRKAMEYAAWLGLPIAVHEEDKNLAGDGYMNEGAASAALGCRGIPAEAEEAMVARDIALAMHTKAHIHFQHLSTKGSLRMAREAKRAGLPITCEVAPHHFALTDKEMARFDANFKMNPPLRSQADIEAIHEALADGTIDAIATDHAPHTKEEKEADLPTAPFGIIGLETALPLTIELLVRPNIISLGRAIELLTIGPAKTFQLDKKGLGSLQVGSPADFTLFDPAATIRVDRAFIRSKAFNTPFKDWEMHGKVLGAWVGGKKVFF